MGLEVAGVFAKLGARLDESGFDRFDRRFDEAERRAHKGIDTKVDADTDKATRGLRDYEKSVDRADHSQGNMARGSGRLKGAMGSLFIGGAGVAAGAIAFGALAKGALGAVDAFKESEVIAKRTKNVIESTGGAANVTAGHVDKLAGSLSRKSGVDDEVIASGENVLLTFTNVRNEVGKGNDIFDQATGLALDMSRALGTDLQGANIQLGKALNDPTKGITALSRVGVSFTKQQKDQIKTLQESGDKLGAQKIILGELRKEFGGAAAASATTGDKLKVVFGNLQESVGKVLAPMFDKAATGLSNFVTGMQDGTGAGGKFANAVKGAGGGVKDFVAAVRGNENAGGIFENVRKTAVRLWDAVKQVGRGIADAFRGDTARELGTIGNAFLKVERVITGLYMSVVRRAIPGIVRAITGLANIVRGVIQVIAGLLTGDFGKVWEGVKRIVGGAVKVVTGLIRAMTAPFREVVSRVGRLAGDIGDKAVDAGRGLVRGIVDKAKALPGALWGAIKGAVGQYVKLNVELRAKALEGGAALVRAVVNRAKDLPGDLWGAIKGASGRVAKFGNDAAHEASSAGGKIVRGVINRAKSLPGDLLGLGRRAVSSLGKGLAGIPGAIVGAFRKSGSFLGGIGRGIADWINDHTPFGDKIKVGPAKFRLPALARGGRVGPSAGGPRIFVAGEGNADEWVISQEGNRGQNVRWAVEALEELTGRRVGLHKGGKSVKHKKPRKKAPKTPSAGSIGARSIAREDRGLDNFERDISRLEREYGQLDRRFDLSDEEYLVEQPDGNVVVDQAAINKRLGEIKALMDFITGRIKKRIGEYRAAIAGAIKAYTAAIGSLTRAIARKGRHKLSHSERAQYAAQIDKHQARIDELNGVSADLGFDLADADLDVAELQGEANDVLGTTAPAPEAADDAGGGDVGAAPDLGAPDAGEPATAAPSAQDVAAAAIAQFGAFQSARQDLFAGYGGNAVAAGRAAAMFGSELGAAAGTRYFGAGETGIGGDTVVNQTFNFGGGPADEHTFSQRAAQEMRAAI